MTWVKGQSGNPKGSFPGRVIVRPDIEQKYWLDQKRKVSEARKAFNSLVKIRDGLVIEQRQMIDENGQPYTVDVVADITQMILVCREILDRTIGKPRLEKEETEKVKGPLAWRIVLQNVMQQQGNILAASKDGTPAAQQPPIEMVQEPSADLLDFETPIESDKKPT